MSPAGFQALLKEDLIPDRETDGQPEGQGAQPRSHRDDSQGDNSVTAEGRKPGSTESLALFGVPWYFYKRFFSYKMRRMVTQDGAYKN